MYQPYGSGAKYLAKSICHVSGVVGSEVPSSSPSSPFVFVFTLEEESRNPPSVYWPNDMTATTELGGAGPPLRMHFFPFPFLGALLLFLLFFGEHGAQEIREP